VRDVDSEAASETTDLGKSSMPLPGQMRCTVNSTPSISYRASASESILRIVESEAYQVPTIDKPADD
jgi:hypothetical protein